MLESPRNRLVMAFAVLVLAAALLVRFEPSKEGGVITPSSGTTTLPSGVVEVAYDDGSFESALSLDGRSVVSVLFTPPSHPFVVRGVKYFVTAEPGVVEAHLLSGALPSGDVIPPNSSEASLGWNTVYFSEPYVIKSGGIFVGLKLGSGNRTWVGGDTTKPLRRKTWVDYGDGLRDIAAETGVAVDAGIRLLGEVVTTTSSTTTSTTLTTTSSTSTTTSSTTSTMIEISDFNMTFNFTHGECGLGKNLTLTTRDNAILFSGSAPTPTPCHLLSSSSSASGSIITLTLSGAREDRVCVFCRGAVPFHGRITGLPSSGDYRVVVILLDGSRLGGNVTLNLTTKEERPLECLSNADCGSDYFGDFVCINGLPMRPFYRHVCVKGGCVVRSEAVTDEKNTCEQMGL